VLCMIFDRTSFGCKASPGLHRLTDSPGALRGWCASRCLRLELPRPGLLESTLRYLYTGKLPGEVTRTMPPPDLDWVFGLMENAKFLLCDELTGDCLAVIKARTRCNYEPVLAHVSFCPDLVPVSFIAEVLVDTGISARVRLEMLFTWMGRAGGPLPQADHEQLRPVLENFTNGTVRLDDATLADLCERFPTGAAVFGPGLFVDLGRRIASKVEARKRRAEAEKLRDKCAECGGSGKRREGVRRAPRSRGQYDYLEVDDEWEE
jgi:hypothetical protein